MVQGTSYRNWLTATWFGFCIVDLVIVFGLYSTDRIGRESLSQFLKTLNRLYVPYLGAVLAYYLSTRNDTGERRDQSGFASFIVAILSTLVWNAVNLFFLILMLFQKASAEVTASDIEQYSSLLSWIVAPAVGYFFGMQKSQG